MPQKLLIIDQSPLIRASLTSLCSGGIACDVTIEAVPSVEAAVAHIQAQWPDLIILGLHHPGGLSLSAITALKHRAPNLHLAVLTNDTAVHPRIACMALGADWVLDKSTEIEALLEIVCAGLPPHNHHRLPL